MTNSRYPLIFKSKMYYIAYKTFLYHYELLLLRFEKTSKLTKIILINVFKLNKFKIRKLYKNIDSLFFLN